MVHSATGFTPWEGSPRKASFRNKDQIRIECKRKENILTLL
jgi:hypothetical protein